jgi:hypothetical protein
MEKSKGTKIILMTATTTIAMISLFSAIMTIAPLQPAYSLSKYIIGDNDPNPATDDVNGKIYQPLEQDPSNTAKPAPTTPTTSSVPVGCAMDPIESLQSFLSCLGAK